jgi:hypothetical protein
MFNVAESQRGSSRVCTERLGWGLACLLTLPLLAATPSAVWSAEYYIDQNNPSASDQNPGTITQPWRTITKANQTLVAGDTVKIRAGTYTSYIAPANSGTSSNRITYTNYASEVVRISGTPYAVYLNRKSYITVSGIHASNLPNFLYIINGSNYNIIAYSSFDQQSPADWDASVINGSSQYNWIHHSQFSNGGECTSAGSDDGSVLDIGIEGSTTDLTRYNLIEDSAFFHGGHHVMGLHAGYNTIRNNYFHNEAWSRSKGNRTLYMNGRDPITGHNVIEGNRFGYSFIPCDADTVGNVAMSTPYNIFRYNSLYHSNAYAFGTYSYDGYSNALSNRIYNNTIYNSGFNINPAYAGGSENAAVTFQHTNNRDNALKNNLYYVNARIYTGYTSQVYANEFNGDARGNPLFVNASTTAPTNVSDATWPDFNLRSGSPAIDAGGALTTVAVADTGSGTTIILSDGSYFQDGSYGPPGVVQPDWIAIGSISNVVQIVSISGNTITLAQSVARADNAPVWLYRKSDGVRVLNGSAPDAGAFESGSSTTSMTPAAPTNLRIVP